MRAGRAREGGYVPAWVHAALPQDEPCTTLFLGPCALAMTFRFSILPVLLFIALLALVAVYWGEDEPEGVRDDGLPLQTVTEEPGQMQDAGPPQVPESPQDVGPIVNDDGSEVREREQVGEAAQRLIQVLGVSGAAAAGADLEYTIYPLEIASKPFFQEWLQDPSLLGNVQFLADALSATSDADGIARISEEGVGIAIASLPGLRGGVAFGPWGAASDDTIVVQLHPYADFEVRVVDHAGRPAEGVSVSVQSAKVDGIPIAEQMWSSVGRSGYATDADGRVKLSTDFTSNQMKVQGLDQPGVALRVSARLPMNGMVAHPVQFKQKGAVTLQLPPLGGARIQLTGYPNHIVPRLVDPTPNPAQEFPRRGSMDAKQERDSEGRFVFERIPLGREFEVRFMRQSATDWGGFTTQSSSIAAEVLAGPVVEGEVVEASFKMEAEQRIVGRLIDEKGEPIKWLRNAGFSCSLLARTAGPNAMPIRMTFELDEDGQFFARTPGPDPRV